MIIFFWPIRSKNLTVTPKNEKLPKIRFEEKIRYTRSATTCYPRSGKNVKSDIRMGKTVHTSIIPGQAPRESTMWQHSKLQPICLKWTHQKNNNTYRHRLTCLHIPPKYTITVESIVNHINCKTTGKIFEYRDLSKMYAPVWKNSMCNELGRISQGFTKTCRNWHNRVHLPQGKTKGQKGITYVTAVCDIRPQKTDTHRTILTAGVSIIDYWGEFSTPTSDLTSVKLHANSAISDIKSRYMCMDVNDF